jgi:hypothetical protein
MRRCLVGFSLSPNKISIAFIHFVQFSVIKFFSEIKPLIINKLPKVGIVGTIYFN